MDIVRQTRIVQHTQRRAQDLRAMVLFVVLEVLRQLSDTLAEYGNLDFRAARIRLMRTEAVYDVGLALSR